MHYYGAVRTALFQLLSLFEIHMSITCSDGVPNTNCWYNSEGHNCHGIMTNTVLGKIESVQSRYAKACMSRNIKSTVKKLDFWCFPWNICLSTDGRDDQANAILAGLQYSSFWQILQSTRPPLWDLRV